MIKKLLSTFACSLMLIPPIPMDANAWGGDGYLLPGRGKRVASRCADGHCAVQGTWRASRQARAVSAYGYGSAGQYGGYGSAGQSAYGNGYGSAGQYGSYGNYVSAQQGEFVYFSDGTVGRVVHQVQQRTSSVDTSCNCTNPNCECCRRNLQATPPKESTDAAQQEFKDGLTSLQAFKSGLSKSRIDYMPTNASGPLLANR